MNGPSPFGNGGSMNTPKAEEVPKTPVETNSTANPLAEVLARARQHQQAARDREQAARGIARPQAPEQPEDGTPSVLRANVQKNRLPWEPRGKKPTKEQIDKLWYNQEK